VTKEKGTYLPDSFWSLNDSNSHHGSGNRWAVRCWRTCGSSYHVYVPGDRFSVTEHDATLSDICYYLRVLSTEEIHATFELATVQQQHGLPPARPWSRHVYMLLSLPACYICCHRG
jgi:hypothetical protein